MKKLHFKKAISLKKITTMAIGGPALVFVNVNTENDLVESVTYARTNRLPWYIIGEGSNLVPADKGYKGLIIKNEISRLGFQKNRVVVAAGYNLLNLIWKLDRRGLSGMERMAGIPGTVGGAIYGCAGAYGQEIKDALVSVRVFDGQKFRNFSKAQCQFGYRNSIFKKHKNWVITQAVWYLKKGDGKTLLKTSREIIKLREKKYPPGLRCPGSFFKNIKLSNLKPAAKRAQFVKKIKHDKIMYGKVPSGYLLEQVGAIGMKQGSIRVAEHHANLIYNPKGGKAKDVKLLANKLKLKVKKKFGIDLQEEIQYLGF